MKCECGGDTKVLDSRALGSHGRRRRQCLVCKMNFTTYELRADSIKALWKHLQEAKADFVAMAKIIKGMEEQ